jgi:Protein of unknown function (DUF3592)
MKPTDPRELMRRDTRIWMPVFSLVVLWVFALVNMNGFDLRRGSTTASESTWKVMFAVALIGTGVLLPMIVLRVRFWNRAVPAVAIVTALQPMQPGVRINYEYQFGNKTLKGEVAAGPRSPISKARIGNRLVAYVDPNRPATVVVPLFNPKGS